MFFCQASWRSLYQQAVWTALSQLPFDTQKIRKMMCQMAFDEIYWLCQATKAVIEGLIMFNCLVVGIKKSYRLTSTGSLGGASLQGFDWPIPPAQKDIPSKPFSSTFIMEDEGFRNATCFLRQPFYIIWQIPASSSIMRWISVFFFWFLFYGF